MVALCAACSREGPAGAAKKVRLKFSTWGSPEEMTINRRIVNAFMEENPGIDVDIMHIPGPQYNTKLQILNAAGVAPDVMWLTAWQAYAYYRNNRIMSLQKFIDLERQTNPSFLQEDDSLTKYVKDSYTWNNDIFFCPLGPVTFHLYYNKTLFDEAGVAYPDGNWTWDDMLSAAKKLTKLDGRHPLQFGIHFYPWWGQYMNFIWQNGAKLFDRMAEPTVCLLDDANAIAALQFLQDLIYKHKVSPSPMTMNMLGGDFLTGKIAMQIEGTWMVEQYRAIKSFEWGMAPLPRCERFAVAVRVCGHGIRSDTKHPEEAWKLVRFYQSERAQRLMGDFALWIPSRESWARDPNFWHPQGVPPNHCDIRITDIKKATPGDVLHLNAVKICETIMPMELDRFWLGQKTAAECVKSLLPKVNAALKEDRVR